VSSAQVAYKWVVVQGYALAFKADTLEYLEEDIDLFSFDFTKARGRLLLPIALVCLLAVVHGVLCSCGFTDACGACGGDFVCASVLCGARFGKS
jgi:hypothetical protein